MNVWLRRVRAGVGMGVIWALGGIALGGAIELLDNVAPAAHGFTRWVDMWPQTLALLAFPCGVLFAIVLAVAGARRRIDDFSLAQFVAWGAVAGLAFGAIAMAAGAGVLLLAVTTALSAIGGATSLTLARAAARWGLLGAPKTPELLRDR